MSKVNLEEAKKWAMGAYSMSISEGYYTASRLAKIPGAGIFHMAAKRTGLAEPIGARNRWVDLDTPPTAEDCDQLMKFYIEYTGRNEDETCRLDRIERKIDILLGMWE